MRNSPRNALMNSGPINLINLSFKGVLNRKHRKLKSEDCFLEVQSLIWIQDRKKLIGYTGN